MVNGHALQKLFLLLPFAYPPKPTPIPTQAPSNDAASYWDYETSDNWGEEYPTCNGNRQSPINIKTAQSYILPIPPIKFGNYDVPLSGVLTLSNNGHSVDMGVPVTTNGRSPYITGGIMKSSYEAVGVHFHWGRQGNKGSEHAIDNRRYDVEMHIVHKNVKYATVAEASEHKDGLAVLGIMFKIVNEPDRYYPGLNKIFNKLEDITEYESSTTINGPITLGQLLGDLNTKQFFTYSGSLTTPNCAEAVTWHVFPDPLPIAYNQIQKFWSVLDTHDEPLVDNYRSLQARNKRPVFYRLGGIKSSNFIKI